MGADRAVQRDHNPDHPAARRLYDARLQWRADVFEPGTEAGRARGLLVLRRQREGGAALADLCRRAAVLQCRRLRDTLCTAAAAVVSAVQSAGPGWGCAGS